MPVQSVTLCDILPPQRLQELSSAVTVGIDIGSRQSKAALIYNGRLYTVITASGVDSQTTSTYLLQKLLDAAGISLRQVAWIVGTGYGRVALKFAETPSSIITEITCHALGAHFLNANTRTIIDIGGQDCKAIKIDPATGRVVEFAMNDKCAAGTGRFLEKAADMLNYSLEELGERAMESQKKIDISSQCVVFAESEIISLKARGEKREDIIAGIHLATARRVRNLICQVGLDPELVFTGGVSNNIGMRHALEELLKLPIKQTKFDMVYNGALGAAIQAQKLLEQSVKEEKST